LIEALGRTLSRAVQMMRNDPLLCPLQGLPDRR
jgi:hypothetical protein